MWSFFIVGLIVYWLWFLYKRCNQSAKSRWSDVRNTLRTGDVILCSKRIIRSSSDAILNLVLESCLGSPYMHGLFVLREGDKLKAISFVPEQFTLTKLSSPTGGLWVTDLDEFVQEYDSMFQSVNYIYHISTPLKNQHVLTKLQKFRSMAFRSPVTSAKKLAQLQHPKTHNELYCTEFICRLFHELNIIPKSVLAHFFTPKAITKSKVFTKGEVFIW